MKLIFQTIFFSLFFFSCGEKFLDEQPITDRLSKEYFANADDIRTILAGAYQPMRWDFNGDYGGFCMPYLYTDVRSDDVILENKNNQPHSHGLEDFVSLTTSNIDVQVIWLKFFTGVANANEIIQGLVQVNDDIISKSEKEPLLAEARFLRAYYYFELVKNFGDVPLFGDVPADIADPNQIKRSPKAEVYVQIESDLEYAANMLPLMQDELYKATQGAAMGLLSKVFLYQEKWQQAADMAQAVVNLNLYGLEEDYGDNWKITNEYGIESLFEISYFNDVSGQSPYYTSAKTSLALQYFAPPFDTTNAYGWSFNLITPELLQAFNDAGDQERRDATIMQEGHEFDSPILEALGVNPIPEGWFDKWINHPTSNGLRYGNDFKYSLKYFLTPEEVNEHCFKYRSSSLNQKVLRYAEILLILAESVVNGAAGNGQEALDQVRQRAGLASVPLTLNAVKLERRLELATEWNRFHDLVRWEDAADEIQGFTNGRDELLPIPLDDIVLVGKLPNGKFILEQNPGY